MSGFARVMEMEAEARVARAADRAWHWAAGALCFGKPGLTAHVRDGSVIIEDWAHVFDDLSVKRQFRKPLSDFGLREGDLL